ncbi:MAG: hypothetical protein GY772_21345 [bacterium]|nr:hypothetical protein [bacterium]
MHEPQQSLGGWQAGRAVLVWSPLYAGVRERMQLLVDVDEHDGIRGVLTPASVAKACASVSSMSFNSTRSGTTCRRSRSGTTPSTFGGGGNAGGSGGFSRSVSTTWPKKSVKGADVV